MSKIYIEPRFFSKETIEKVEEKKNAKFVVETCIKDRNGSWVNQPFALFYTEEPHPVSNSHYFVFYYHFGQGMVASGQSAVEEPFTCMEESGKIYHSVFRHDYHKGWKCSIDGGRDYVKLGFGEKAPKTLLVKVVDDHLEIVE